jgi:hypothetical protein
MLDKRFAFFFDLLDFLSFDELVLRLLASDDDPLRLSSLLANDDRCRGSFTDDDWLWLLEIFCALAVSFKLVRSIIGGIPIALTLESEFSHATFGFGWRTFSLAFDDSNLVPGLLAVEVTLPFDDTIGYITTRLPFQYALGQADLCPLVFPVSRW